MNVPFRPITRVLEMIQAIGLDITHMYEDLVFVESNAFILRMEDRGEDVTVFFNHESEEQSRLLVLEQLTSAAKEQKLKITCGGTFEMVPREDEQIDIRFCETVS